jgi:hypothetical protein
LLRGFGDRAPPAEPGTWEENTLMSDRLLSMFGFVAHIGDLVTSPFRLASPSSVLRAGTARIPGSVVVAVLLGMAALASFTGATYAETNKEPTAYTIYQLTNGGERGGRDYAAVTGSLYDVWVDESDQASGDYKFTYYLLGEPDATGANPNWIVVKSTISAAQMRLKVQASPDGRVTLTGMLTYDSAAVSSMLHTLAEPSLNVDPALVLQEGETPMTAGPLYTTAAVYGAIGLILFVCWLMTLAVGYVAFRPALGRRSPLSAPGAGMLPVRVTGLISGYRNGKRARELRAELRVPPTDPAAGPVPIDLVWQTVRSGPTGIRLIPGISGMAMGTAYPVRGARPAIKARFGRYDIVVSFDNEVARDAAFDQITSTAGLTYGPNGATTFSQV